jgi:hypothetical protein
MANALTTSTIITNEVLRIAHNTSAFLGNMNTDFSNSWKGQYKPGSTVKARRPVQFTHRTGSTANVQDITESSVDITVQPELGIDFAVSSNDLALSIGSDGKVTPEFKRRYLMPAGLKISAMLDYLVAAQVKNSAYQFVGTPGTPPANVSDILNAKVPAQNMGLPPGEFYCALNPAANASVVSGLSTLYNDQTQLAKQYKTGVIKTALGVDFLMSQNLPTHTVGALGGSGAVNGANQGLINAGATDNPYAATTSLVTNGWSNSITGLLKAGDVITIAGVNSVNPETKQSTGSLQTFVVTADVNSDGSGNATLVISPAIIAGGAFQNVSARPATSAAITVKTGSANTGYSQNMLWHPDAITFVSPEQELPGGMDMAYQASLADEGSISLRFVRGFDITNNRFISRFDVLWGVAVTRPDWVVRRTN